jgi:hypothetical protein
MAEVYQGNANCDLFTPFIAKKGAILIDMALFWSKLVDLGRAMPRRSVRALALRGGVK